MSVPVHMRTATVGDVPALAHVFEEAARRLGPQHYDAAQVASWAAFPSETEAFHAFIVQAHTLVAEVDGAVVGFGGIHDDGYLASLYTHPDHGRKGIGTLLLGALLDRARDRNVRRVFTAASAFSRPLFERHGFILDEVEVVERRGAVFHRFRMSRALAPGR